MSYFFPGANSTNVQIQCGSRAVLDDLPELTAVLWAHPTGNGPAGTGTFLGKNNGQGTSGWAFQYTSTVLAFIVGYDVTDLNTQVSVTSGLKLNQWHPYAVTWDGTVTSSTGVHIYKDLVDLPHSSDTNGDTTRDTDAAQNLLLGQNGGGTARNMMGYLSQVQLFNRVLSDDEIRQVTYYPGSIKNGLVGYWPLRDGETIVNTRTVEDVSGNSNHGFFPTPAVRPYSFEPPIESMRVTLPVPYFDPTFAMSMPYRTLGTTRRFFFPDPPTGVVAPDTYSGRGVGRGMIRGVYR